MKKIKDIVNKIIPPCPKCPYTLGHVKFVANPCFQCKSDNYNMYYRLINNKPGNPDSDYNE